MKGNYIVFGPYDERTIKFFKDLSIFNFSFDLRVTSFNFIQEYRLIDLVKNAGGIQVNLHFSGEKDFIINKIIKSVSEVCSGNIYLEFSDLQDVSFYESFHKPYFFLIDDKDKFKHFLENVIAGPRLAGIIFSADYLNSLYDARNINAFVLEYYGKMKERKNQLQHILFQDWCNEIFPSIQEFFDFDCKLIPINHHVETCYRNVDLKLIESNLRKL